VAALSMLRNAETPSLPKSTVRENIGLVMNEIVCLFCS
jgi:hypothetical protein